MPELNRIKAWRGERIEHRAASRVPHRLRPWLNPPVNQGFNSALF
jgi:hypothetical protein